jgi:WD40 repeat protein
MSLAGHNGPIFSLKWDCNQTMLLSGCADRKVRRRAVGLQPSHAVARLQERTACAGRGTLTLTLTLTLTAQVIVWDFKAGRQKQEWALHQAATLDVDWRDATSFASCSSDKLIYVYSIGMEAPLRVRADGMPQHVGWGEAGRVARGGGVLWGGQPLRVESDSISRRSGVL